MLGDKYIFLDEVIRFISEHEKKKDYEAGTLRFTQNIRDPTLNI